jgi:multidrug resistance efflux pump
MASVGRGAACLSEVDGADASTIGAAHRYHQVLQRQQQRLAVLDTQRRELLAALQRLALPLEQALLPHSCAAVVLMRFSSGRRHRGRRPDHEL